MELIENRNVNYQSISNRITINVIVAIIISKNHCFLKKPTIMFKRVFIENEEIEVFMCFIHAQKDALIFNCWLSSLYKTALCPLIPKLIFLFQKWDGWFLAAKH
jgi:hypothetical protein